MFKSAKSLKTEVLEPCVFLRFCQRTHLHTALDLTKGRRFRAVNEAREGSRVPQPGNTQVAPTVKLPWQHQVSREIKRVTVVPPDTLRDNVYKTPGWHSGGLGTSHTRQRQSSQAKHHSLSRASRRSYRLLPGWCRQRHISRSTKNSFFLLNSPQVIC